MSKKKLFKAYHADSCEPDKIEIGFYASVQDVEDSLVERDLAEWREHIKDYEFGDVREMYLGQMERIKEFDDIYEILLRDDIRKNYKIHEIELSGNPELKLYKVLAKQVDDVDTDLVFVEANDIDEAKDIAAHILLKLHPYTREFFEDTSINMSFAEFMYHDEHGYMFELDKDVRVRDDIYKLFENNLHNIDKYLDFHFEKNVREFFKHDDTFFADFYLDKCKGVDVEFPGEMYHYMYKHFMMDDYDISEINKLGKAGVSIG